MKKIKIFHIEIFSGLLILLASFLFYKGIYQNPRNWYDHYLYLSNSFLESRVDVPDLPDYFQDVVLADGRKILPFPPTPALILIPFVIINPNTTQQQVSVFIGALDVFLVFLLLRKFTKLRQSILLSVFFALGTAHFWASIVGTTWYFAHSCAILFLTLSLLFHFSKKDFLSGILLIFAVFSRYPMLFGLVFFMLQLKSEPKRLFFFILGFSPFIPLHFLYNFVRFNDFFRTGYFEIYQNYAASTYPYTILQLLNPGSSVFGYMDVRNIPLHLFTFLLMPPIIKGGILNPSPYGMGIILTSPLLFLALIPPFKSKLERNLVVGALFIALIDFMHYMQGWVQFSYRFALDFLVFLLIVLAIRFKITKISISLIIISLAVNIWGVLWAIKLGW